MNNERQVFAFCEESKDLTIVIQELFLAGNLTAAKFLFEELKKFRVLLLRFWLTALLKIVIRRWDRRW